MTPPLPLATRIWLYLYGYPNILGSLLGLAGLGLYFFGLIGPGWGYLVAGLYMLGALLAWQLAPATPHLAFAREAHAEALLEELELLVRRVRKRLPKSAQERLENLHRTLAELLPRLGEHTVFSEEGHSVEKTVREYLPATLESYLRLPPAFAHIHPLQGGKTAETMLLDQLTLLEERMQLMLTSALAEDARALAENGAFLEHRFRPYDFFKAH
ncbi:MAG: hypothetical protein LDL29_07865 [Dechloromonas sp.]|uniref:Uncharacterized protein n=1 Tax=Azonexus hydrophilus TaxID=418702 RepID=A0ABZ2XFR2_9RHOO|nr:hypothetical protein [Dechloromonas sp.]